ncbi:VOC family protein [Salinibacterium sp.]|uniref:VOC family protein n=1 Tax=Salinibacterium sp. TaxID=1915057 RepID=UPI00286CFA94|nr:VOC family protein [Salinibacterium sp.]
MTPPQPPRQLRLIIETDNFDDALYFYRDVLGMPEQPAFATDGDDRVSILHAGIATIELATPAHIRKIDTMERAATVEGPTLRIALEVDNTPHAVAVSEQSGATTLAPPTETPFRTINARVQGPAGWQVTFFKN